MPPIAGEADKKAIQPSRSSALFAAFEERFHQTMSGGNQDKEDWQRWHVSIVGKGGALQKEIGKDRTSRASGERLGVDAGRLAALIDSLLMYPAASAGLMPKRTSATGISHNRSQDVVCMRWS